MKNAKKCGNANTALEEIPITHRIIVTIVMTERLSSTLWVKQTKIYFISLFTNDDGVKYRETQGYLSRYFIVKSLNGMLSLPNQEMLYSSIYRILAWYVN